MVICDILDVFVSGMEIKSDYKLYILVKWKNYDESYNTWEPADVLAADVPELVRNYLAKY